MGVKFGRGQSVERAVLSPEVEKLLAARAVTEKQVERQAICVARLLDFRPRPEPSPLPLQLAENLTVGVRTLRGPDLAEIGVWMASAGYSLTATIDTDSQSLFNAALLLVGISDATGASRFFGSLSEVEALQSEPSGGLITQELRAAIFAHNGALLYSKAASDRKAPDPRNDWEKRIVKPFLYSPDTPDDGLSLIRWAAYHAGPVARSFGLFHEWRRQDPQAVRTIAESLPLAVGTIERQTHQTADTIVSEFIKRTQRKK